MKNKMLVIVLAAAIIALGGVAGFAALAQQGLWQTLTHQGITIKPTACTQEAKLCSDGSYVSRTGPNCQFSQCPDANPVYCTQDVKQCADGSYVSRSGPKCEFAQCPQLPPPPTGNQINLKEGQKEGPLLVEKIYPTYITGLSYREYPVARDQGQPVTVHIGESVSNGCTITLTLIKISNSTATFTEQIDNNRPCPICLAENTLIDTPNGQIPVQQLKTGMPVWSVDKLGNKVSATIIKTSKTPVPKTHQMVHIILEDGRQILASPGHPIGDGRVFNDLSVGSTLNGSRIMVAEKVLYDKGYTYDILPSGTTGFYFANGILIDSTLH